MNYISSLEKQEAFEYLKNKAFQGDSIVNMNREELYFVLAHFMKAIERESYIKKFRT